MFKFNLLLFCLCTLFACTNGNDETATAISDEVEVVEKDKQPNFDKASDLRTSTEEFCFISTFGENPQRQDSTFVNLTISGNKVTGEMHWHPFEKDGGHGTLSGARRGNLIEVRYDYTIEGSEQSEDMIFQLEPGRLTKKVGELVEDSENPVHFKLKDPAAAEFKEVLKRVICTDRELH